jgi:prepilin-type N-terminal cleavage/methylation domain-containing protein
MMLFGALDVGVFDAQKHPTAVTPRVEQIEDGRARTTYVKKAGRRRGESELHRARSLANYNGRSMRGQRGFTLVEILAAFVILTLVITVSLLAFLERNRRSQQANEIILSYQALANEAEYWRRKPFATLQTTTDFDSDLSLLAPLKPYVTTATVVTTPSGTKNVTLRITWREGQREAKLGIVRADTGSAGGLW